ncbi:hypothetical protein U1Q18_051234 [Sarracenia purpurea var. burkii]
MQQNSSKLEPSVKQESNDEYKTLVKPKVNNERIRRQLSDPSDNRLQSTRIQKAIASTKISNYYGSRKSLKHEDKSNSPNVEKPIKKPIKSDIESVNFFNMSELEKIQLEFEELKKQVTEMEPRVKQIEGNLSNLDSKATHAEARLTDISNSVQNLQQNMNTMTLRSDETSKNIKTILDKLTSDNTPENNEEQNNTNNDNSPQTVINNYYAQNTQYRVQLLLESGIQFNETNIYHPHRFIKAFEQAVQNANLQDEEKAMLFRGAVKLSAAQTWKENSCYITDYDSLKADFLATYWDSRCQEDAMKQFQLEKHPQSTSLNVIIKELRKWGDTITQMGNVNQRLATKYLYDKLPFYMQNKLNCQELTTPAVFFEKLSAVVLFLEQPRTGVHAWDTRIPQNDNSSNTNDNKNNQNDNQNYNRRGYQGKRGAYRGGQNHQNDNQIKQINWQTSTPQNNEAGHTPSSSENTSKNS